MTVAREPNIVVVGIGNRIRTDDGFGVHAIERLQHDPRVPAGVTLLDGGTFGLELLTYISDSTHLLLLDALDVGEEPGALLRMANQDLRGLPGAASVHQVGLADLLATLPLVSPDPREIVLLGVQPASTDWGTELSPAVAGSLDSFVDAAIEQVLEWVQSRSGEPAACSEFTAT